MDLMHVDKAQHYKRASFVMNEAKAKALAMAC